MTFGQYLKEKRKEKGLSQRKLASLVGVNFSYISKIESDTLPPPSDECLKKIAIALDLDNKEVTIIARRIPEEVKEIIIDYPHMMDIVKFIKEKNITFEQIAGLSN